jgi:hypothetical protein
MRAIAVRLLRDAHRCVIADNIQDLHGDVAVIAAQATIAGLEWDKIAFPRAGDR